VLGAARIGSGLGVAVLPTDQWGGTLTRLWLRYDSTALAVADSASAVPPECLARVEASPHGQASLEVECSSWQSGTSVALLGVEVLDGLSHWTDITLDTVSTGGTNLQPGTVLRLFEGSSNAGLPMDFDGSGVVDFDDFFMFADRFGSTNTFYDFDGDGRVDLDDFFLFADSFGKSIGY
jgi:hypothetical protein